MAGTVSVACKHPHGLVLRIFDMVDSSEPVMGGGMRDFKIAKPRGESVEIKGYATPFGKMPDVPVHGGYAITSGVDADFWTAWLEQNKNTDLVRNKIVFAAARSDSAQAEAKEKAEIRSGLEPIDPNRLPKGIETATTKDA